MRPALAACVLAFVLALPAACAEQRAASAETPPAEAETMSESETDQIPEAELIGAMTSRIQLTPPAVSVELEIRDLNWTQLFRASGEPVRVLLSLQHLRSDDRVPVTRAYVNLPPDVDPESRPDLEAGIIAPFGLQAASRPDGRNVGDGLSFGYDITDLVMRLALTGAWDRTRLRVTLVPEPSEQPYSATLDAVSLFIE